MGGHANGQEASHMAIQIMTQSVLESIAKSSELSRELLIEILANSVQQANVAIWHHSQEACVEMGTTITAALVLDITAYIVNVGDSRTYLYRESEGLGEVTHDHSYVARLVEAGRISPDDVYTHPHRNLIYRSLGNKGNVEVDWFTVPLRENDYLLLCSDGLWEMVRKPEIERIMKSGTDPKQMSDALVQAALQGGGKDNVSVIVARVV